MNQFPLVSLLLFKQQQQSTLLEVVGSSQPGVMVSFNSQTENPVPKEHFSVNTVLDRLVFDEIHNCDLEKSKALCFL